MIEWLIQAWRSSRVVKGTAAKKENEQSPKDPGFTPLGGNLKRKMTIWLNHWRCCIARQLKAFIKFFVRSSILDLNSRSIFSIFNETDNKNCTLGQLIAALRHTTDILIHELQLYKLLWLVCGAITYYDPPPIWPVLLSWCSWFDVYNAGHCEEMV